MSRPIVNQYAPQVCLFDAVGNETFAIQRVLSDIGLESEILCDLADTSLHARVRPWSKATAQAARLTIVHYSHGSKSIQRVFASSEPKVLLYHNITPAKYFQGTHPNLVRASELGRQQLAGLANRVEIAVAHSTFSANELREYGFSRVEVVPYVALEPLLPVEPDRGVMDRCSRDGWVNLICVAQVAPHKCIEDCLFVFDYFKRFVCPKSRLFVIGGWAGTEAYRERLRRLVDALHLSDVVFTGQVSQESLVAYYKSAHAFLCMSEHEGFCVPLVEAMDTACRCLPTPQQPFPKHCDIPECCFPRRSGRPSRKRSVCYWRTNACARRWWPSNGSSFPTIRDRPARSGSGSCWPASE